MGFERGARTEGEHGGVDEREQHQQRRLPLLLLRGAPRRCRRVADADKRNDAEVREIAAARTIVKLKVNRGVVTGRLLTRTARRRRTTPSTRSELVEKKRSN